jgi:hypothetical protein
MTITYRQLFCRSTASSPGPVINGWVGPQKEDTISATWSRLNRAPKLHRLWVSVPETRYAGILGAEDIPSIPAAEVLELEA